MIDPVHLARLEAAASASRAALAQLEGQAAELAARRAALEDRRLAAARPAVGLAGGPDGSADDLASIEAELTAAAGLANATAASLAAERRTLADAEQAAGCLRSLQGLADACQARADAFAYLADAWASLEGAIVAVQAAAARASRAVTSEHAKDGARARFWHSMLAADAGMTTGRRQALEAAARAAKDARADLANRGARLSALPTLEADALEAAATPRKEQAA